MLRLLACPAAYSGDEVVCGFVLWTRRLENAGRAFFDTYEITSSDRVATPSAERLSSDEACETDKHWDEKHKNDKKGGASSSAPSKLKRLIDGPNLYAVLGLEESCSMDAVKKAYRRYALEYHPDKQKGKTGQSQQSGGTAAKRPRYPEVFKDLTPEETFVLIQDAYETLSDPTARRQYDSALPFDESVPTSADVDENDPTTFFDVFSSVFSRNARWSAKKPVPSLGTLKTPHRDVMRFYAFWRGFDSIRDFSVHDEYDLGDAECREERRWMERQNQKVRRKDPRVKSHKEEERRRKEEQKETRRREAELREQQRQEEEMKRINEEKARQAEVEEHRRRTLEEKQRFKAKLKKNRQQFRELCRHAQEVGELAPDDADYVATSLSQEELESAIQLLEGMKDTPVQTAHAVRNLKDQKMKAPVSPPVTHSSLAAASPVPPQTKVPQKKPLDLEWTPEELSLLAKGVQKYPGGTARRWQLISTMIGTKSVEAVIEKTKQLADGSSLKSMGSSLTRKTLDQFLKDNAGSLKPVSAPPDTRDILEDKSRTLETSPETAAPTNDWTEEQQRCLEAALKEYPPSLPPKERWTQIAAKVSGKSPKDCLGRFKEIRNAILKRPTVTPPTKG